MEPICGIYKITSPTKKIYIGQSLDIKKRWRIYRSGHLKSQKLLLNSFLKYGAVKHSFEIICECKIDELNDLEIYYIDLYQSFNTEFGLNLKSGGSKGKLSDITKRRIGDKHKGKTMSVESNEKNRAWHLGKKMSKETKDKMRKSGLLAWEKRKQNGTNHGI